MSLKKNNAMSYAQNTQETNSNPGEYRISFNKAVSLVVGIVVATIIGTLGTLAAALNSSYFTVVSNASRIDKLEESIVPRTEFREIINKLDERDQRIEEWQKRADDKLDYLVERK